MLRLAIVFLALFAGIGLDKLLGTKPVFTIIFDLGLCTAFAVPYLQVSNAGSEKYYPPGTGCNADKPVEEEEKRE